MTQRMYNYDQQIAFLERHIEQFEDVIKNPSCVRPKEVLLCRLDKRMFESIKASVLLAQQSHERWRAS